MLLHSKTQRKICLVRKKSLCYRLEIKSHFYYVLKKPAKSGNIFFLKMRAKSGNFQIVLTGDPLYYQVSTRYTWVRDSNELRKNQNFHFDLQIHPTLLNSVCVSVYFTDFLELLGHTTC